MAAAESGQVRAGLELIRAACAADPRDPGAHAQLARWLSRLHRHDEALAAARHALDQQPAAAPTLDTIGVVFARAGLHEAALPCFERAVALTPARASLQFNLASTLKFLGQFEAAEAAYEECLRLDPRFWRAHSALAATRRQTLERNHVERLQALLAAGGLDADAELHLRHALARELEDLGREDEAFAHLLAGNARKHATVRYDFERDRRLFETVTRLFAEPLPLPVPRPTTGGSSTAAPIFVVGLPRTGTTLVERILSSHTEVCSAGESQAFGVLLKRACRTPSPQVLDEATLERSLDIDLPALGLQYLARARPPGSTAPRFVDKMPLNYFYLAHIARALPDASLVVVRRDPRDTGLSLFRQLFATGLAYYEFTRDLRSIGRYYACFDRLVAHWREVLPGRIHELSYEALVADPRAETARLLGHCGLPWQEQCLAFELNAGAVATASAVQVREPLHSASIGRWRRYARHLEPLLDELRAAGIELPA